MTVESLLAYLTAFSAFCLTGLLIALHDFRTQRRFDPLNPGLALLGLYSIYNFLAFCDDWSLSRAGASHYLFLATLGLLGVMAGTFLAYTSNGFSRRQPRSAVVPLKPLFFSALILTGVCLAMLALMYKIRVGSLSALMAQDSLGRASARGGLLSGFFFVLPWVAGLGIAATFKMSRFWKWPTLAFYGGVLLAVFYVAASRNELLWACLIALYLYHYNIRKISTHFVAFGFGFLVLFMLLLGIARARQGEGLSGMLGALNSETIGEHLSIHHLEPHSAMLRGMNLLLDGPPEGQPLYGASYLWAFELLPPRFLYPGTRPQDLNMWYVTTYDPYTAAQGGAYNFPPLVEAYWNFGAIGCFLFYAFFGWLVNMLHLRSQKTLPGSVARFFVSLTIPGYILLMQSAFAAYLKSSVLMTVVGGWVFCLAILLFFGVGEGREWTETEIRNAKEDPA
jgi:oligosaccharide repeat unit polymerase